MWKIHFKPLKCYCFIRVSTFLNQDEWNQPPPPSCICSRIWVRGRSKPGEEIIYERLQTIIYRKMVVENKCTTREIATILAQWTLQLWPFKDALKDFKAAVQLLHRNIHYLSQEIKYSTDFYDWLFFFFKPNCCFFFKPIYFNFDKVGTSVLLENMYLEKERLITSNTIHSNSWGFCPQCLCLCYAQPHIFYSFSTHK